MSDRTTPRGFARLAPALRRALQALLIVAAMNAVVALALLLWTA